MNMERTSEISRQEMYDGRRMEEARVNYLINQLGYSKKEQKAFYHELYDASKRYTDYDEKCWLSFAGLDETQLRLPICLFCTAKLFQLDRQKSCMIDALLSHFPDSILYDRYQGVRRRIAERDGLKAITLGIDIKLLGRPFGLVFKWPGMRHGMILHDAYFPEQPGAKYVYQDENETLTLESYSQFVEKLVAAVPWGPEALRPPFSDEFTPPESPRAIPVPVNNLASRVENLIQFRLLYAFLEQSRFFPDDTTGWLSAGLRVLADWLGTNERTVRRAFDALVKKGLMEKRRGPQGTNQYRVNLLRLR